MWTTSLNSWFRSSLIKISNIFVFHISQKEFNWFMSFSFFTSVLFPSINECIECLFFPIFTVFPICIETDSLLIFFIFEVVLMFFSCNRDLQFLTINVPNQKQSLSDAWVQEWRKFSYSIPVVTSNNAIYYFQTKCCVCTDKDTVSLLAILMILKSFITLE